MINIAIYPSNHGFGHASRMVALASGLHKFGVFTHIRTDRPTMLFSGLDSRFYTLSVSKVDFGVIHGPELRTDIDKTKQALFDLMANRNHLVEAECSFLRDRKIDLVVADIPFLAVEAAAYVGIPCVGISNFDWHFIYSNIFKDDQTIRPLINAIFGMYTKLSFSYQMPFSSSKSIAALPRISTQGLLAKKKDSYADPRKLHSIPDDELLVVSSHGGEGGIDLGHKALCKALDGYLVSTGEKQASNHIIITPDADFPDYFKAADIILTKPGYSSFAEAVQYGKPIVYRKRQNYPEEEVLIGGLFRYKQSYDLGPGKLTVRNWKKLIKQIKKDRQIGLSKPIKNCNNSVAAQLIADYLQYSGRCNLVSVFDMGTNNLNYCLYDGEKQTPIHTHQLSTGLGKGFTKGMLKTSSIRSANRTYKLIKSFDDRIVSSKHLIATAICRSAQNIELLRSSLGEPRLKVISANEEIRLVYHTIKPYLMKDTSYLAFDLGGGSTEFLSVNNREYKVGKSLQIGLLSLYQDFSTMMERKLEIRRQLSTVSTPHHAKILAIGLSPVFLQKVIQRLRHFPQNSGLSTISKRELIDLKNDLAGPRQGELIKYMAEPANSTILEINCIFMLEVLDRFAADEILVCHDGISTGYARKYSSKLSRKK